MYVWYVYIFFYLCLPVAIKCNKLYKCLYVPHLVSNH